MHWIYSKNTRYTLIYKYHNFTMFSTPVGLKLCSPLTVFRFYYNCFTVFHGFLIPAELNLQLPKTFFPFPMQCDILRCFFDKFSPASYNISAILSTILSFLYQSSYIWLSTKGWIALEWTLLMLGLEKHDGTACVFVCSKF